MRLVDPPKYGPLHRFGDQHVYRVLHSLSDGKRRGRKQLAELVGIGEGSMRTIVAFLREKGMIEIKQTGVKISSRGVEYLRHLPIRSERLEPSDISVGSVHVAVQVIGKGMKVTLGIEQRDSAIKAGAEGATTVLVIEEKLIVPPDYWLDDEKPQIAQALRSRFKLNEGDVIIIGTAPDYNRAEDGALAAAFGLL
jgi:hypothetical protein